MDYIPLIASRKRTCYRRIDFLTNRQYQPNPFPVSLAKPAHPLRKARIWGNRALLCLHCQFNKRSLSSWVSAHPFHLCQIESRPLKSDCIDRIQKLDHAFYLENLFRIRPMHRIQRRAHDGYAMGNYRYYLGRTRIHVPSNN